MSKPRVWEWEDGQIGVRGARTVAQARALAREYAQEYFAGAYFQAECEDLLARLEGQPAVWAVPGTYFWSNADEAWGDATHPLASDDDPTPKGYARVYWWAR